MDIIYIGKYKNILGKSKTLLYRLIQRNSCRLKDKNLNYKIHADPIKPSRNVAEIMIVNIVNGFNYNISTAPSTKTDPMNFITVKQPNI